MKAIMKGLSCTLAAFACLAAATPAHAQFGGLRDLVTSRSSNDADTTEDAEQTIEECEQDSSPGVGRRILGGLLGSAGREAAQRVGIPLYVPVDEFTDQLSTAIACRLDPQEQRQAAEATVEATRVSAEGSEPEIGATSSWVSGTREGVSGRSTVTARETAPEGADCITVSDIIIVSGEETRADKRMCRIPPAARYSIVA